MVKHTRRLRGGGWSLFGQKKRSPEQTEKNQYRNIGKNYCTDGINTQIGRYLAYIETLQYNKDLVNNIKLKLINSMSLDENNMSHKQLINKFTDKIIQKLQTVKDYINRNFSSYYNKCKTHINNNSINTFSIWWKSKYGIKYELFGLNNTGYLSELDILDILCNHYIDEAKIMYPNLHKGGKRKQTQRHNKRTQKRRKN